MYLRYVIFPLKGQLISNQYMTSNSSWTIPCSEYHVAIAEYADIITEVVNLWCIRRSENSASIGFDNGRILTLKLPWIEPKTIGRGQSIHLWEIPCIRPTTTNYLGNQLNILITWYLIQQRRQKPRGAVEEVKKDTPAPMIMPSREDSEMYDNKKSCPLKGLDLGWVSKLMRHKSVSCNVSMMSTNQWLRIQPHYA